ncbi:MAG: diguanylate cyclase [Erythrobacter sp.]|nr:diguanylate cyclase [Erythrobacter sp.]
MRRRVSRKNSDPQVRPDRIGTAAVLGLSGPEDGDWVLLRGIQFAPVSQIAHYRMLGHFVLGALVLAIYHARVDLVWLGLWAGALAVVHIRGLQIDRQLTIANRRRITREEYRQQSLTSAYSAIVWSVPILFFAPNGPISDLLALWIVMSLLMLSPVLFGTSTPLSSVILTAITGSAAVLGFVLLGQPIVAIVALLFALLCALGTVEVARTFLMARLAERGVAEKDEVVSLLLREFEENEADWLWQIDTLRRVRSASPRFAFALGRTQKEVEGKPLLDLIAGNSGADIGISTSLRDLSEKLKRQEHFSNFIVQVSIMGEERWWELSGTPMLDDKHKFLGFRGVGSDITEKRKSSEKIAYLARFDTLTSLPNRLQLTEALSAALDYADKWRTRCALLMVDLDRFKAINDSLGHMVGDKLLAQVSSRLQSLMGEGQLCGRLGGDEFAIVINDVRDGKVIRDLSLRIIEQLSEPYSVDNNTLYVGASVGSAMGPRDGSSVEELMRNADLALYRAKDVGGGEHCHFEPALHALAEERLRLEAALRGALSRDEFKLQFQPVVNARSEDIVSFEALVRWHSPELGFISPAKFIPLAEDTRQIIHIGRWVLHQACMEARNWPEHVKVNINVSPEQLLEPDYTTEVISALAASGLRPDRLEIEVTESIFMRDPAIARAALEQVMALGCSVAMDDFGTGYSSLGYLRKLHFSTIKVDRTFVDGAAQGHAESLAIIRAVVAMAQSLDMTTTAEGVETEEQLELVRTLGCDKIQGYYFGRPMEAKDARALFRKTDLKRA